MNGIKISIKNIVIATLLLAGVVAVFPAGAALAATAQESVCEGAAIAGANCDPNVSSASFAGLVTSVINILSVVVGIIAVIMIIIAGFKYVTAGGDSNAVNSAKNTIIYAIVGLVVVAFAQLIVAFVLGRIGTTAP